MPSEELSRLRYLDMIHRYLQGRLDIRDFHNGLTSLWAEERNEPGGNRHQYPCTVGDIRRQLAWVPEYELEGLWAIGLCPCDSGHRSTYGTYYRRHYPERKPMIVLWSDMDGFEFKLNWRSNPGFLDQFFRVEREYGMQLECCGTRTVCRWSKEAISRFLVEHVLLHEIGHHVLYQQRQLSDHRRQLPSSFHEQFAEDYAIRFHRQRREL